MLALLSVKSMPDIKVLGHMTPYSVYFGKVNSTSYSALLGNAHKIAQTEYGLRLAMRLLEQGKMIDLEKLFT